MKNAIAIAALGAWLILAMASNATAQIQVPTRQHDTLTFRLLSLRDDVTLYMGDPQELLLMNVHPIMSTKPRVTYSGQANADLEILDQESVEAGGTHKPGAPEEGKAPPYGQRWDVRVSPSGPTSFALRCEQGKSSFDFTDFQVQKVELAADGSNLDVGFRSQNAIVLESCYINAKGGSLRFHGLINARAKEISVFVPQTECQIEVTGKSFEGESSITLQGPPASMQMALSKKVGVRIAGPAATIARFAAGHMVQAGDVWVSRDYAKASCRIQITFADEIPKLSVKWN